jgi:LuxR family maltose regulon positive regulatory protein
MSSGQPGQRPWGASTKLRPPALPPDFVPRTRVHQRLTAGWGRPLLLVCAPAGFGKTIALAGWLHESPRLCAWVSLDELDSDLVSFTSVLVSALGTVVPNAGHRALALATQTERPPLSQLSALLADDLAEVDDDLVIVLDDFHLIRDWSVHALLSLLARRLPPTIQIVIASREAPPVQLALLRGRRELAEIRADDLRFDRAEAMAFVRGMSDAPLDLRVVAEAVDRSEGWAVGLRLLSLINPPAGSSQAGPTPTAAREPQVVDAYLLEEVLSRQRPELRRFLTQTSILDRFCAPLCEAVVDDLQPGDAQRLLDESMAAGLFLTALDDERRWYRFHHLFRDMLRRCLERDAGPEHIRALRLRASDWLAGQRLWDESATQAIDANDVGRVTSLVETCLLSELSISVGLMLDGWIHRLPPDVVEASPTLLLARCGMLTIRGDVGELESLLRRLEMLLAADPSRMSQALLPIARGQIERQLAWVLHLTYGADHEALARLERALELLPMDQYDNRGGAAAMYAFTLHCVGRTDDALAWISTQFGQSTELHPDYVARLLIGRLYVELAAGRLPAADQTGRRMVAFGTASQQPLAIGWGHFAQGRIAYEWNDLDGAREHFEAVLALGRDAQRFCTVNATLGLALTRIARGERGVAERLVLGELEQAEEADNAFLVERLRSFMARLALASDNPDGAVDWLASVTLASQGTIGFDIEDSRLTRARVLVARATSENLGEASAAVNRAIEAAEARHMIASLVGGLALRALVEHARGETNRAAGSITRALEVAGPGQFTRTFVDLGPPLTRLLAELASRGALPTGGARVLVACRAESVVLASGLPGRDRATPEPAEALTWRDLDVLLLMDGRFSSQEIARLLGIPEETVKRHATNIYRKLQVTGREDAVLRAYDLGVLRAEDRETPTSD